ncbi:aconitate hydratase AcnA [Novosphingobium resinovorum]|uniref:aconitate hydratase AcnA n=1 Tax=Novosphingobium TaxID=165696 RepID=UPI001B3C75CB|nr:MULTISPECIES: aconitate hydratase AcnA [Novosphingobium]MBF7014016.1 aconitate hydratase AcnA [Novosphingobium sp. HR1a]WJM26158.1 aconitate hydratase AcnA [Novosphingobium resinovorum]
MTATGNDTLGTRDTLTAGGQDYAYYSLPRAAEQLGDISRLPFSLKVLLENLLRFEDGASITVDDIRALVEWQVERRSSHEIQYRPARVLMQDFTGVPCMVDLAAMRDTMNRWGADATRINPQVPIHLVIDHSVMADEASNPRAFDRNVEIEYERNAERYAFLKWGASTLDNLKVVPPGTGICHQVNLEHIAQTVWTSEDADGLPVAYPDTCVGTDSHTTMVSGLGVLGWGVGGIEAEAAMLGQPVSMLIPDVVGFRLIGALPEGVTATDLVLTVTQMLRRHGVVGRFVEFCGPGLDVLPLADRATIANMAPEYGATCGFFPVDEATLTYLRLTGRDPARVTLVEAYAKAQGLWRDAASPEPMFTDMLELDLATVLPSVAGPRRPQDRVLLKDAAEGLRAELTSGYGKAGELATRVPVNGKDFTLGHGDITIAAITSCTNTSNPSVLVAAGLVARKARALGLVPKPWVRATLSPGSQVVTDYLIRSGLQDDLDALGFALTGYGCMICIGNSGSLDAPISEAINAKGLVTAAVLSGNRNFEGRISPDVRANYLASPPLVVAYALLGSVARDITTEPLGTGSDGQPVYLKDVWPTNAEVAGTIAASIDAELFAARYADVYEGDERWKALEVKTGETYEWPTSSTYIAEPPFFKGLERRPAPVRDIIAARCLAVFGDSITTDHISPAGSIKPSSPAGRWLQEHQVLPQDFNSYGCRRGNHEIMMRGTFANIRIRNEMMGGIEGGMTLLRKAPLSIYEAAMRYKAAKVPLVVVAGAEYGTGSSRDWAAKGTALLGVRAVIAESFERIHRSNLVGMGVLPLQFDDGVTRHTLGLNGTESFTIRGLSALQPRQTVAVDAERSDGARLRFLTLCRIDTADELAYYLNGGILPYVLRNLAA